MSFWLITLTQVVLLILHAAGPLATVSLWIIWMPTILGVIMLIVMLGILILAASASGPRFRR